MSAGKVILLLCMCGWARGAELSLTFLSSPDTPLEKLETMEVLKALVIPVNWDSDLEGIEFRRGEVVIDAINSRVLSLKTCSALEGRVAVLNWNHYKLEGIPKVGLNPFNEFHSLLTFASSIPIQHLCVLSLPGFKAQIPADSGGIELHFVAISESATESQVDRLVRETIKPQGHSSFLLNLPVTVLRAVFKSFSRYYRTTSDLLLLLTSTSAMFRFSYSGLELESTGPLCVIRTGCEHAKSSAELMSCEVDFALRNQTYGVTVMNIVNRTAIPVATISPTGVSSLAPLQYPSLSNRATALSTISFSMNSGVENWDGSSPLPMENANACVTMATEDLNANCHARFKLNVTELSLGADEFNTTWAQTQLSSYPRSSLGVAMLTGLFSKVAIGVYSLLESLSIEIPQIGATNTVPQLSSPKDFPLYTRVIMSNAYMTEIHSFLLRYFGWKRICVVYASNSWATGMYKSIVTEAQKYGITISNQEQHRLLPGSQGANDTAFRTVFAEVVSTQVRVLLLFAYGDELLKSVSTLYDLGMRRGDIVFLATDWLTPELFVQRDEETQRKVVELCQGAIMLYPASFVGEIGANLSTRYHSKFGRKASSYCCYYYDAVVLLSTALDYTVSRGLDYHSAAVLNAALKGSRFRGCSGLVTIESGTNDRSPTMYSILNARLTANGAIEVVDIGTFDPSRVVLFHFSAAIQWPGNSTTVPSDLRANVPGCAFQAKHLAVYSPALALSFSVIAGVCAAGVAVTLVLWMKCWRFRAKPMRGRSEVTFQDYFVYISIGISAVQYSNFGPALHSWAFIHTTIGDLLLVRLDTLLLMAEGRYWVVLSAAIGVVVLWMSLLLFGKVRFARRCKCVMEALDGVSSVFLPTVGNQLFLPVVSALLSVFQCSHSVDTAHHDLSVRWSYLLWDCSEYCWTHRHLAFAVASGACLSVFIPAAVCFRPAWQHLSWPLHIHTSPSYYMLKTIYELSILALEKTVKREKPLAHFALFCGSTVVFTLVTLKSSPYGYVRANLWHFLSLVSVLWVAALSAASSSLSVAFPATWVCLYLLGLLALASFGAVYQVLKLPALLYSRSGRNVVDLFHFMLSRGARYNMMFSGLGKTNGASEYSRELRRTPTTAARVEPS